MSNLFDLEALLSQLRSEKPLVQCITNYVAMNIAANVVLASGASPAMVHAKEEASDFAKISKAVTINIGTLSPSWVDAMVEAAQSANENSVPWVFDPVAHFATQFRSEVTKRLLTHRPTIIRANASEVIALSGQSANGAGADSGDDIATATQSAIQLANETGAIIAATGRRDFVTNGKDSVWIEGGSGVMPQITALGCSLTALTGAFAGLKAAPFDAAVAALALFAVCGERAAKRADGPGSFSPAFLDQLSLITPADFAKSARIYKA